MRKSIGGPLASVAIGASTIAAAPGNWAQTVSPQAEKQPVSQAPGHLEKLFSAIRLTDQQGVELKPAEVFKDKPCLVMFGFNGCERCQKIAATVASVQQRLLLEKHDVPIMVVSVQPETDSKDQNLKPYVAMYYEHGVRQFAGEKLPGDKEERSRMGEAAYENSSKKTDAEKTTEQSARIFHIVCPPTAETSKSLQTDISKILREVGSKVMLITHKNPKEHTAFITLFDKDGKAVDGFRALDSKQEAPPAFADEVAKKIAGAVSALKAKAREK